MNRSLYGLSGLVFGMPFLACSGVGTPEPAAFTARVSITGPTLFVFNDSDSAWTNVVAAPQDAMSCTIGAVPAKGQGQVALKDCTGTPPAVPITQVRVSSAQGEYLATLPPTDLTTILGATPEPSPTPATPDTTPAPSANGTASTTGAAPKVEPAARPAGPMKASGSMSGGYGPARRITINNETDYNWSGCKVTLNGDYYYSLGELAARTGEGIMLVRFKDSGGNVLTANAQILKSTVKCNQGSVTFTPR